MKEQTGAADSTHTVRLLVIHPDPNAGGEFDGLELQDGSKTEIVGRAASELTAMRAVMELNPDVVLVEVDQDVFDAFALAEALTAEHPDGCLVFVGDLADPHKLRRALTCGAHEYLIRPLELAAVADALYDVITRQRQRADARQTTRTVVRTRPPCEVIGLISTRGETGRSMVAVNLAIALHQESEEAVTLIDAGFGDACFHMKLTPTQGLAELGPLITELDETMLEEMTLTHSSGVEVLSCHSRVDYVDTPPFTVEALHTVLSRLRESRRYVIVDFPPWPVGSDLRWVAELTTALVVVTGWDLIALRDSRVLVDSLQRHVGGGTVLRVVLNRQSKRDPVNPDGVQENLNHELCVKIPNNTSVVTGAMNMGNPLMVGSPDSDVSRAIRELARKVAGVESKTEPQRKRRPLFRL